MSDLDIHIDIPEPEALDIDAQQTTTIDFASEDDIFGTDIQYKEIYTTVISSPASEIVITIPTSEVEKTKTGIKNYKGKLNADLKEKGLPADDSTLIFFEKESTEFPECTCLTVALKKKASVKVYKIEIVSADVGLPE